MYWIIDALVVLFAVFVAIRGYKRGLVDSILSVLCTVILFALAVVGGPLFLLLLYKVGAVNDFAYALLSVIGETNSLFQLMDVTAFDVCQMLAALIFVIIGWIISTVIFVYVGKGVRALLDKIPSKGVYGGITGVLGMIFYLVLYLGVIMLVLALINMGATKENEFFVRINEFIRSCQICGWISKINPLNGLFA